MGSAYFCDLSKLFWWYGFSNDSHTEDMGSEEWIITLYTNFQ